MSQKPIAAFVGKNPDTFDYVYSQAQKEEIARLTDLKPGVYGDAEMRAGKLMDVEYIFSTWGMITPTEEEIRKYLPKVRIVFYGAGATDFFARPFFACNIPVLSAWLANAIPVAEVCLAQILLGLKSYYRCTRTCKSNQGWVDARELEGPGIYGDTVALIGAGAISQHLQELLKNFNVNVLVVNSRPEKRTVSLEEAFSKAYVVSNHLPNRDDNVGVLNGKLFASMRQGATFINTGRGAQINEKELCEVLKKRPDLTALLDVTFPEPPEDGSELYTLPNVQLSPHLAGSLNDEVHRMADYMISELKRALAGEPFQYQVKESMLLTSKN